MLTFKHFLIERQKISTKSKVEKTRNHIQKYVEPYVGSEEETHELAKGVGHLPAGEKVKIHSVHSDLKTGNSIVTVSGKDGKQIDTTTSSLYKPVHTDSTKKEKGQLDSLNDQISKIKGDRSSIKVMVGDRVVNVSSAKNVKGTPKADFALHDENGNAVHYISHKDGSTVKHFQQLGGISHHSFSKHPFVSDFVNKVKKRFVGGVPKGHGTVGSKVLDQNNEEERQVGLRATFGHDHGKEYGINNVHSLMQGNLKLEKHKHPVHGDIHRLVASGKEIHNENSSKQTLPFNSRIYAMHRGDRNDQGLQKTRIYIAPEGSRKVTHEEE